MNTYFTDHGPELERPLPLKSLILRIAPMFFHDLGEEWNLDYRGMTAAERTEAIRVVVANLNEDAGRGHTIP